MSLTAPPVEPSQDPDPAAGDGPARRRWWRWPARITFVAAALVVGYFAVTFVQVWMASRSGEARPDPAQAIVVLGAAQYDGRPSPVLESRLRHALALYRDGRAPTLVVTGGRQVGDRYTEATAGYNWLRRHGVRDGVILKEVKGRNTWESLAAVARFLRPRGVSDVILVSDASHSLRLRGVSDEVGLDAAVSPALGSEPRGARHLRSLARETVAVGIGRLSGYRRLTNHEP
jgi:uncharacterized SAM-binding protein YcdF (DUF218 family)